MGDDLNDQIAALCQRSQHLLLLAQQQAWEAVSEHIETYTQGLQQLCERDFTRIEESQRQAIAARLSGLLAQDAQLRVCLQQRIASVRKEMSSLRQSHASARAYLEG